MTTSLSFIRNAILLGSTPYDTGTTKYCGRLECIQLDPALMKYQVTPFFEKRAQTLFCLEFKNFYFTELHTCIKR